MNELLANSNGNAALTSLNRMLDCWAEIDAKRTADRLEWHRAHSASQCDPDLDAEMTRGDLAIRTGMVDDARPFLHLFLKDNSNRSAVELEEIATKLSPGGTHTGALLAQLIQRNCWYADPLLLAATFWVNWHGGKAGFQFLPDPAKTDPDEYELQAFELLDLFEEATEADPRRLLTGDDLAFFDSLPDRLTVYRGCAGVSEKMAGMGVCWTTKRDVAEWFADRSRGIGGGQPVLMTARIRKTDVRLAKASELEVVCNPARARAIKCRTMKRRPEMEWTPGSSSRTAGSLGCG